MRFRLIERHGKRHGIRRMCRLLGVSRSGYYAWRSRSESKRSREDRLLLKLIRLAFAEGRGIYGYRRVHPLVAKEFACGKHRVARLMRENGIQPKRGRRFKFTTNSDQKLPVAPKLLLRDFAATMPNEKWVADVTYIRTAEGWLYLAAIEDLFSRFIVGWSLAKYLNDQLTRRALIMALGRRQPSTHLLHHSDRGVEYASRAYRSLLNDSGITQSMSRKANALDNAPMESFYSRLKDELIHGRLYQTRDAARRDIFEYIEVFYNRQRLHSALGYRSPLEFEALHGVA